MRTSIAVHRIDTGVNRIIRLLIEVFTVLTTTTRLLLRSGGAGALEVDLEPPFILQNGDKLIADGTNLLLETNNHTTQAHYTGYPMREPYHYLSLCLSLGGVHVHPSY